MTPALLHELAWLFRREADAIQDQYAWPPKVLTDDERRERDRLDACSRGLAYRARVAEYEETGGAA